MKVPPSSIIIIIDPASLWTVRADTEWRKQKKKQKKLRRADLVDPHFNSITGGVKIMFLVSAFALHASIVRSICLSSYVLSVSLQRPDHNRNRTQRFQVQNTNRIRILSWIDIVITASQQICHYVDMVVNLSMNHATFKSHQVYDAWCSACRHYLFVFLFLLRLSDDHRMFV